LVKAYEDEMFQLVENQQAEDRSCLLEPIATNLPSNPFSCGVVHGHCRDEFVDQTNMVRPLPTGSEERVGSARSGGPKVQWFNDTFKFEELGWKRAKERVKVVMEAIVRLRHRLHSARQGGGANTSCWICNRQNIENVTEQLTERVIQRVASCEAEQVAGGRHRMKSLYSLVDGVWYSHLRLGKEGYEKDDLDFSVMYDAASIKKVLPVMSVHTSIGKAFMLFLHLVDLLHSGVEATFR
jgi:hypothetical protein